MLTPVLFNPSLISELAARTVRFCGLGLSVHRLCVFGHKHTTPASVFGDLHLVCVHRVPALKPIVGRRAVPDVVQ